MTVQSRFLIALGMALIGSLMGLAEAEAQQVVRYTYRMGGDTATSSPQEAEAVLRMPKGEPNGSAVVILHHAGGWSMGTTSQYGEYLSERGFVTLEPRMFISRERRGPTLTHVAQTMGALQYLAQVAGVRRDAISVMGLSYGAWIAIYGATDWFYQAHGAPDLRFQRVAALYPMCWMLGDGLRGQFGSRPIFRGLPPDFMQRWSGIDMKIFTGDQDDYDDRDPTTCESFVSSLPDERQRRVSSVRTYPGATHGWDHGMTYSFPESVACKGRGCVNTNRFNPQVTSRAKQDLLEFLKHP